MLFKLLPQTNDLLHNLHLYGLSPVWIISCSLKESDRGYIFLQVLHSNDLEPVRVLSCFIKSFDWTKALLHFVHLKGNSPVWFNKTFSTRFTLKSLHPSETSCVLSIYAFSWTIFWQISHWKFIFIKNREKFIGWNVSRRNVFLGEMS